MVCCKHRTGTDETWCGKKIYDKELLCRVKIVNTWKEVNCLGCLVYIRPQDRKKLKTNTKSYQVEKKSMVKNYVKKSPVYKTKEDIDMSKLINYWKRKDA